MRMKCTSPDRPIPATLTVFTQLPARYHTRVSKSHFKMNLTKKDSHFPDPSVPRSQPGPSPGRWSFSDPFCTHTHVYTHTCTHALRIAPSANPAGPTSERDLEPAYFFPRPRHRPRPSHLPPAWTVIMAPNWSPRLDPCPPLTYCPERSSKTKSEQVTPFRIRYRLLLMEFL